MRLACERATFLGVLSLGHAKRTKMTIINVGGLSTNEQKAVVLVCARRKQVIIC